MNYICYVFVVIIAAFSNFSFADQLSEPRTVTTIFAESDSTSGFYTAEGLPQCKWGIMFIDMRDSNGNEKQAATMQVSMLLTAKAAGYKIYRMDYTVAGNGTCRLSGLHIN